MRHALRLVRTLLAAAVLAAGAAHAETLYGALDGTAGSALITFDSSNPSAPVTPVPITGLTGSDRLIGIDLRPTTGVLYGIGRNPAFSSGQYNLYTLNPATGAATFVAPLSTFLSGRIGIDFNPAADLAATPSLRITDCCGDNVRAAVDPPGAGVGVFQGYLGGATGNLYALAYTNNDVDPSTGTALYGIGQGSGGTFALYQMEPASGVTTLVGGLGIALPSGSGWDAGFDVSAGGTAFASLPGAAGYNLYTLDLATGAPSLLGAIATTSVYAQVTGISAAALPVPEPGTSALMAAGLAALGLCMQRRRRATAPVRPELVEGFSDCVR